MAKNKNRDFHEYIMGDVFSGMSGVTSRAMFGGYGIYKDGKIFAIIVEEKLYFKAGNSNKAEYERAGSEPFRYTVPNGKVFEMAYWELPADILEDRDELPRWMEKSLAVNAEKKETKGKKK
ncbi:MAG: hypothetical protein A2847_00630 [Candidatus Sungbacteria bacterium RIFCSPHIGHO2_01_FULL_50_25]|uniref:TfoX N-terminal domain-containing protein n=1 Tax=Candidatus Sungbacteria bacterium RIFCSPHIGHO2_01_FULL_50_25 TaxID=1802265 RepID=A0A1G2KAM9_9BACT|nr:MAG: hypothetical protein A2847_00630 [Candidatus Sungbacteria bacterium RIFCSPHIGHO2_01_FULL_50_25]